MYCPERPDVLKARALSPTFGNALALNAMRGCTAIPAGFGKPVPLYEESLRLLDGMDGEDVHIRMLLVER